MKRGEVWTSSGGGDFTGKPRPVVIVQDDVFDDGDSVTVCAFTSFETDSALFRAPVDPDPTNGLHTRSWIMVDKVTTVKRTRIGARLGHLSDGDIEELNRALLVFLGLAR